MTDNKRTGILAEFRKFLLLPDKLDHLHSKIDILKTDVKDDTKDIRSDLKDVKTDIADMKGKVVWKDTCDKCFDGVKRDIDILAEFVRKTR